MQLLRFFAISLILMLGIAAPARAITLLRDPDIEYALRELATPILRAAGLSANRVDILVIDDPNLNAFVVDSDSMFIHSGLILRMKTPAMLQSVIAHEAAHIANGHLMRRPINARNARTAAGLGTALAIAAGAAAGSGEFAAGAAAGLQGAAMRSFFSHTRAEENAADQSGMRFMKGAGVDLNGSVEVMEIFRGQEALSVTRQDAYARTHPLSRDRYRLVRQLAGAQGAAPAPDPQANYWFARAKGKLSAFQRSPKWTLTRAGESGFQDVKLMRQAVAYHRQADLRRAMGAIDGALALRPKDPYLHELRGQILIESRQIKPAVAAYARATNLASNNPLILGSYGRALLADGQLAKAQQFLEKSRARDGRDPRVMRDLAVTYAKQGNNGMASVLTAERYAMVGRLKDAKIHAKRATDLLPRGSAAWQRAQDVLSAAQDAEKRR
ncbi:Putative Zn-dependent protease, contains TPR repeats [Roseovarius marisflavi]|uniref:Putative Zn-dependent protease, contains TPR repeats n=1 Tax=Roseovarius marisflavi TaxID=1054996 RepID=A0A1M6VK22_9RHOB|nr:M48 family metalloprotease [Roseovarius marisflavi]SHK81701.1 Putative Zn-dependent protease, contains TPR repeats [Roseovarius marisflavi]